MFKDKLKMFLRFVVRESGYKKITEVIDYFLYSARRLQYSSNSDPRVLAFDWKSANFNRIATLNLIANTTRAESYLEIGCSGNDTFDSIPIRDKVGVDPFHGGNVRLTSDIFFENNNKMFDLIFIDGDHDYRQARRDLANSLKVVNRNGVIVLHDMLPRSWVESHVPILTPSDWTGDVWKIAFELVNTKGIDFKIIKIDQGVGVVKILGSDIDFSNQPSISMEKFSFYYDNLHSLPIVEWHEAVGWLKNA